MSALPKFLEELAYPWKREIQERPKPVCVDVEQPVMGGKCFTVFTKGMWVLEEGPGMFQSWLCTAAGSGGVVIRDGIPDKNGIFEGLEEGMREFMRTGKADFNGKPLYIAHPAVMQPWALNGGFHRGLTLELTNTNPRVPDGGAVTVGTIVWHKHGARKPTAEKKS
jgi:hypothetical protein